ncbi:5-methyltetrahydropteroyltriglutamate--homocysteine S-methyltransferase [Pokkaliibacter sp. CJK22405]|uniref:5-methyltetrahydropteroyltriglutamate-- homocysteine S-methyltransferase n=1 Tax=Pokkaliibacter sp. CJK22405 TaxID=3384615 RepID=UPI00398544F7
MAHIHPPFRAEHVGSLLRPTLLLEARDAFAQGKIDAQTLRDIEDQAIAAIIQRQQDIGLKSISDGEFRRTYFHLDFLQQLGGVEVTGAIHASNTTSAQQGFAPPKLSVVGPLRHKQPIEVDNFHAIQRHLSQGVAKVTLPSPTMVHFRGGRAAIDVEAYPDLEPFFEDLATVYQQELDALYQAGCRYVQLDDTNLAYLCDPKMRAAAKERGENLETLPLQYAELINKAIGQRPKDMVIGIHLCRGNFRSSWFAEGGYEAVADVLFNALDVDTYFLEYDDARSGDFSPLRYLPSSKTSVLGIVSSKVAALEDKAAVIERLQEAVEYTSLDQLCLSPQCGFASTVHGNALTEEEQWAKLKLVVDIAKEIWGE